MELKIHLPKPHPKQEEFIRHPAKRKMVKAGRRSGKTVGSGTLGVEEFLSGHRVLYAAPTMEQLGRFWTTVVRALEEPIKKKFLRKMRLSIILSLLAQNNALRLKRPGMPIHYVEIMPIY
jgi:hypothetical protein